MLGNDLWIQFIASLDAIFLLFRMLATTLWGSNYKEWIMPPHVISSLLWGDYKPPFPSFAQKGLCRFYIKSSTWHHIFIFFATFKDDEKFCRSCVYSSTEGAKTTHIMSQAKNERGWWRNISTLTNVPTWQF